MILESINTIKEELNSIKDESVKTLPNDILPQVLKSIQEIQKAVNSTGDLIQKYYNDKESLGKIHEDLMRRMNGDPIYSGLSLTQKTAIADKIIREPNLTLANEKDLREYVVESLRRLSPEELVTKAYTKSEIIHLGRSLTEFGASEGVQYSAGLRALSELAVTPSGFEDAVAHGEDSILKNPKYRTQYLLSMYGMWLRNVIWRLSPGIHS